MFKSLLLLLIATAANAIPIRYDNPSTGGISEVTADGRYWVRTGTAATGNYSLSGGSWSFVLGGSTFSVSCNGDRCFRVSGSGEITGNMIVGSTLTVQGNAFSVGGSTFVVVGGKVGIGVAAPTTPLDIQGGGSGMYFSTASNPSLGLYGSGGTVYIDGVDSGDNLNFVRHATLRNSAFNAARFYWTNTSNVEHGNIRLNTQGGLIIDTEEDTNGGNIWLRPNTGDGVSFGSGAAQSTFTASGFWEPISKTKAQIDALTPTKVGQIIYASDVTLPGLCVSTGTAVAQWRKIEGPAGLGCGTNN